MLNGIIYDVHYCQLTLINQYFSNWSLWYSFSLSFPAGSFFQPRNTLSLNHGSIYSFWQPSFVQWLPSFRIQGLECISLLHTSTTFPELNNDQIWYLPVETLLRKNSLRISRKYLQCNFPAGSLCFLLQFYCNSCPSRLLYSTSLTSLLDIFSVIQQELFPMSILKKFAKTQRKNRGGDFFGEVVYLHDPNLLKWNSTWLFSLKLLSSFFDVFSRIAIIWNSCK